ncbi:MAG: hypothetical protein GEV08_21730 [Acidimicrobiia bacterium]|nr:hypothetical protein [Acidimicrobiia bacterium]
MAERMVPMSVRVSSEVVAELDDRAERLSSTRSRYVGLVLEAVVGERDAETGGCSSPMTGRAV